MKVLIIDDSKLILFALGVLLKNNGYEVLTAANGIEGLEVMKENPSCHVVITDWEMPEMDGIEFCKVVRSQDRPGYVYLIILSSNDKAEQLVRGLTAGADDFIIKPYNPAEVLARLRAGERILSLETRDIAIFALAKLAESRDKETGAHLERVQHYCRALSQNLAATEKYRDIIDSEFISLIFRTSPLHDIGKVGIPDAILHKSGRLEPSEFEIMKTHTTIAARTLDATLVEFPGVAFLKMAKDIAESHHERFDGAGYPYGLKGAAIPLCGRILAVADVYDALVSERIYKDAFAHDSVGAIIEEERGKHFDPDIVDAFLAVKNKFLEIHNRFNDV